MTLSYEEKSKQPFNGNIPGTVSPAPKSREIPRMIDELQSEINALDEAVQTLCEKCSVIAQPERPSEQPDKANENIHTELGHQLFHIISRVRTANCRILDLRERIQL